MIRAVVSQGEIRPLEPLPQDWEEGQFLRIEKAEEDEDPASIDQDFACLEQLCRDNIPEEEQELDRFLAEMRREAKEQVRKQMGLE